MYHNIDKSAFRPGQYVGYSAAGYIYQIAKGDRGKGWKWFAQCRDVPGKYCYAETLKKVSEYLERN